ncbi:hypothetical protein B296_00041059 [Ensete ventricosum]|uniref:Uncharacterized protein n=1 Tax=Ensete ventricosum TaxID=4639 RepID=A0A426ZNB0_ENSVE|nr:hypothetical protein B296_00041059 [Ensete ventricosum]
MMMVMATSAEGSATTIEIEMTAIVEESATTNRAGYGTLIALDNTGTEDDSAGSTGRGRMATWKREEQRVLAVAIVAVDGEEETARDSNGNTVVGSRGSGDIGIEMVVRDSYGRGWQHHDTRIKIAARDCYGKGWMEAKMAVTRKKQCWDRWQRPLERMVEGCELKWEAEMAMRDRYSRGMQQQWQLRLHRLQATYEGSNSSGRGNDDGNAGAT